MAVAGDALHDHRHHELDEHHEQGQAPLGRRLLAEFVGTLLFVAVGTGAATVLALGPLREFLAVEESAGGAGSLGPQSQLIQSLTASTFGDLLGVAFAFAFALTFLVYALGGVSGAHFNPAVTFALAVARRFRWTELPLYWIAQVLGGIAGAFVVAGIYGQDGAALGATDILFGATTVSNDVTQWQALLSEAFIAFILMTAIMAVAVDHRAPKGWSGLVIGLGLASGIMVTGAATGGSANFARSLGPFVASLVYEVNRIPWSDLIVYSAGPLIGAAAAALVYESVTGLERSAPAPEPGAATHDEDLHDHADTGAASGVGSTGAGTAAGGVGGTTATQSSVTPGLAPTGDDPAPPTGGPKI
ncbi:MAG: aquaporin [Actinomycetota bacterium]|nr:aquaporin [Actinomycetota bacterium]